jgi:hypothetical protein
MAGEELALVCLQVDLRDWLLAGLHTHLALSKEREYNQ